MYYAVMQKKIEQIVVGDIQTNCWLYALDEMEPAADSRAGKRPCVVIDPGEEGGLIISRLRELQWFPKYIFLTHGHFDHLAALPDLIEAFRVEEGDRPQVGIHRLDAHYLGKNALDAHRDSMASAAGSSAYVDALWKPLPEADLFFEEGSADGPFKVLHLPGHTQGSVALFDESAGVLFSGDTLFQGNWGRTDLPGGDEEQIYQSLRRLLGMKKEIVVCPGHGPVTSIGDEQRMLRFLG